MCDPVTIAVSALAVSTLTTAVGFVGQNQAADANRKAANMSAANSYNDLGNKGVQIDAQNSENNLSSIINAHAAKGAISASASAFGTGEASTAQLANAADYAAGRSASISQLNANNQRLQLGSDSAGVDIQRQAQIASKQGGSGLSLALGFAGDALGAAGTYHDLGGKF